MNDSAKPTLTKPTSAFDEICHLTEQNMRSMDLDTLHRLRDQAERDLQRATLAVNSLRKIVREKLEDFSRSTEREV